MPIPQVVQIIHASDIFVVSVQTNFVLTLITLECSFYSPTM
jgi:hypothetical protein